MQINNQSTVEHRAQQMWKITETLMLQDLYVKVQPKTMQRIQEVNVEAVPQVKCQTACICMNLMLDNMLLLPHNKKTAKGFYFQSYVI